MRRTGPGKTFLDPSGTSLVDVHERHNAVAEIVIDLDFSPFTTGSSCCSVDQTAAAGLGQVRVRRIRDTSCVRKPDLKLAFRSFGTDTAPACSVPAEGTYEAGASRPPAQPPTPLCRPLRQIHSFRAQSEHRRANGMKLWSYLGEGGVHAQSIRVNHGSLRGVSRNRAS